MKTSAFKFHFSTRPGIGIGSSATPRLWLSAILLTGTILTTGSTAEPPFVPPASVDAPPNATVTIDLTHMLDIGGKSRLERQRYFNVHAAPRALRPNEWARLVERDHVSFGRAIGAITALMREQKQDPRHPGHIDLQALQQMPAGSLKGRIGPLRPQDKMIFAVDPQAYYPGSGPKDRFVPGDAAEAGAAIAAILGHYFDPPRVPAMLEVINEPFVHLSDLHVDAEQIIKLHRAVARVVHQQLAGEKVGGPALAWPEFEQGGFKIWHQYMGRFISEAGPDMDFLSLHLYGVYSDKIHAPRFGSNIEAILDLVEASSHKLLGHVLPIVVSEYGATFQRGSQIAGPYTTKRDWIILSNVNGTLFSLLDRPDRLLRTVPFLLPSAPWYRGKYPFPYVLYYRKGTNDKQTELIKFYDLWANVHGKRFVASSSDPTLRACLFVAGDTAYLALENWGSQAVTATLRPILPGGEHLTSVRRTRLYWADGSVVLSGDTLLPSTTRISLNPNETAILNMALNRAPTPTTIVEQTYYADQTIVPISTGPSRLSLVWTSAVQPVVGATLRLAFFRTHGQSLRPAVTLNGCPLSLPRWIDPQMDRPDYFGAIELSVPPRCLRENNGISVRFSGTGGYVSSAVLLVRSLAQSGSATP